MKTPRAEQCDIENPHLAHSFHWQNVMDACEHSFQGWIWKVKADYVCEETFLKQKPRGSEGCLDFPLLCPHLDSQQSWALYWEESNSYEYKDTNIVCGHNLLWEIKDT